MKRLLILFSSFICFKSAFGQDGPTIMLNEGEIGDTTVAMIDGRGFGFRIDWGQDGNDTCKYEFIHGRANDGLSRVRGNLIGKSDQFIMHDIRRVMPRDRLIFNLSLDGKKFSRSYHVLSTKASETRPWYFNIFFVFNGDTLSTDTYEILFHYPKDTTRYYGLLAMHYSRIEGNEKYGRFVRYYFINEEELPESILIKYKKYGLTYEFIAFGFFHGDIYLRFTEKRKKPKNIRSVFNAAIEFKNKDADGWGTSRLFHMYVRE